VSFDAILTAAIITTVNCNVAVGPVFAISGAIGSPIAADC